MPPTRRSEIGAVGLPIWNGLLSLDPNRLLRGAAGAAVYRDMWLNEPAATALLNAASNLLRTDIGVTPGGNKEADKRAAELLQTCMYDMREDMGTYIRQMYSMLWAGWDVHELIYKRRGGIGSKYADGMVGWSHWGLRRQETLYRWQTQGTAGDIVGFEQRPAPDYKVRQIPLTKCIHLTADDTEGSPEGMSVLRGMYRSWFMTKNLELLMGISLERFGTGFPIIEIDATMNRLTESDQTILEEMVASIRQNEEAGGIMPPGARLRFAESPGLRASDYLDTIKYYRVVMLSTALADFIALGTDSGSYALGKDKTELFLLALNGWQDRLINTLNRQAVTRLFRFNDFGKLTDLPRLTLPAVKRYDLAGLGVFAELLHRIGAFHPTPADEARFREISELIDLDESVLEKLFDDDRKREKEEAAAAKEAAEASTIESGQGSDGSTTEDEEITESEAEEEEEVEA